MKVSSLIAWLGDGTLHSVVSETRGPIDELAGIVRKERAITVGKKSFPVVQALVLQANGGDATVVKRIQCAAEAKREALVAESVKAKAKAEAEAKAKAAGK
jgi:hypothetical protein